LFRHGAKDEKSAAIEPFKNDVAADPPRRIAWKDKLGAPASNERGKAYKSGIDDVGHGAKSWAEAKNAS
jgi:hypothetical protein